MYVSIEATTTRASTVIRSIPTSETRTHASTTMPLSRTRSRTSMRLVPPGARSTGGIGSLPLFHAWDRGGGGGRQLTLQLGDALLQTSDRPFGLLLRDKRTVVAPPVQSDLLGFIDR